MWNHFRHRIAHPAQCSCVAPVSCLRRCWKSCQAPVGAWHSLGWNASGTESFHIKREYSPYVQVTRFRGKTVVSSNLEPPALLRALTSGCDNVESRRHAR